MLKEILEKYQDKQPFDLGKFQERVYPISAVISMMEEYAELKLNNLIKPAVSGRSEQLGCDGCRWFNSCGLRIDYNNVRCDEFEA